MLSKYSGNESWLRYIFFQYTSTREVLMLTLELFYKVQSRTDLSTENFANLYGLFDQVFLESDHIKTNANKD